ncbi:MAG: hypothetical protein H0W62_13510 [Chitinophagales bacterium]|nr:hypothetical protein [Chitinophagales bacterium]
MKKIRKNSVMAIVIIAAALLITTSCQKEKSMLPVNPSDQKVTNEASLVIPPHDRAYSLISAKWWQWALKLPVENHPFLDTPGFDVTEGQSGPIWYLASVLDTVVRNCTIPAGKGLFVGMLNAEASSLEGYLTEEDQRANAEFNADHIHDVFATVDGTPVKNIDSFRAASPQFHFFAPTPWIFGETGGPGTAVADGYYLLIKPLSAGSIHVIHYSGRFHFSIAEGDPFDYDAATDMTYNITVK